MSKPRIGDEVIYASMINGGRVVGRDATSVTVESLGGRRRKVLIARLECIDMDAGLWQEMDS